MRAEPELGAFSVLEGLGGLELGECIQLNSKLQDSTPDILEVQ